MNIDLRPTTLLTVVDEIGAFYDASLWHFVTLNGNDLGEGRLMLQWIFSPYYAVDTLVIFETTTDYETIIPTVTSMIPSAIMSEREVVDMFGVEVVGAAKGLYLDGDSRTLPLVGCSI
ncbi:MAG: NADH dehydrogenase [Sulfurovum sp. PC08-66]|nr:MAG: NADH dehydrogenase [Sulfurovum sp. PC08-66]KIM12607.1 MAG: NADH dehydrogenase [Sulfuricurvum sp. PC08-66]